MISITDYINMKADKFEEKVRVALQPPCFPIHYINLQRDLKSGTWQQIFY